MTNQHMVARKVGDHYELQPASNYPKADTTVWAVWGAALTLWGLQRLNLRGLMMLAIGGGLIYRGVTGRSPLCNLGSVCSLPKNLGSPSYQNDDRPTAQRAKDDVEEMSMGSFPASDPPARHVPARA